MPNVIELKHYFYEAFLQRAERHSECRNFRKAIRDYTKAIELQPDGWKAYFYRGRTYGNAKDYGQAISDSS